MNDRTQRARERARRRAWRARVLLLAVLGSPALAGGDKTYRAEMRRLQLVEKSFWEEYDSEYRQALRVLERPGLRAHTEPDYPQDATPDYSAVHKIYADYEKIETQRGAAILANAGDTKRLFKLLLDTSKHIDALEKALHAWTKRGYWGMSKEGVARHGLARREAALVEALSKSPAFLMNDGWKQAVRKDGKKSWVRRVAVIDAVGLAKDPDTIAFLAERSKERASTMRIAALEALIRFGAKAEEQLAPLFDDPSLVVRFALLQAIRAHPDPCWTVHVKRLLEGADGRLRAECEAALGIKPKYARKRFSFYGYACPSRRVVFLLEGSHVLSLPAEDAFRRTKSFIKWEPKGPWTQEHPSHEVILKRELRSTLSKLPDDARFGIVALRAGRTGTVAVGEKNLLTASKQDRKKVEELLATLPGPPGGATLYSALLHAMAFASLDASPAAADFPAPRADTIYVVHSGRPIGGRNITAASVVAAFRRLNRFRRLQLHTIRIGIQDKEGAALMRGLAEVSGGTHRWQKDPPN